MICFVPSSVVASTEALSVCGTPSAANDRYRGRRRRIEEVVGRQSGHLREVAKRRLASVSLPVRVGDETDRDIEGEAGRHAGKTLRVDRQITL
jgi:hypothetical protein